MEKSEKDIITEAAKRIGVLIEEFSTDREITIRAYYDITISFDTTGKIIDFNTHP